jgi:hypothetical protein
MNMYSSKIFGICLWLIAATVVLLPTRQSLSQTPEVLAKASMGELQLELYIALKKPFGLDGKEHLFRFMDDEQLNAITGKLTFGPWGESERNPFTKDEYVLGFLVRNARGEIPTDAYRLATAFRATLEGGQIESYWPRDGQENPLSEVNAYEWDYRLAPMVLGVPKGTQRIDKLEGALVLVPQDSTLISLTKEDIQSKAAAYARQVAVFAVGVEQTAKGTMYSFFICRSEKGKAATSRQDTQARPVQSVDILVTGKTSYGERVRPNLRSQIGINDTMRRKLVSEVVTKTRKQPTVSAIEEAMLAVLTDPKADFNVLQVAFGGEKIEFDEVEIAINVTTGLPKLIPFEFSNIPLPSFVDEDVINEFVASQPLAQPAEIRSPLEFRTWRDATGSFSVEAKFLGIEADAAHLQKKNGDVIKVPVAKLSQADRDYVLDSGN